jgi:hypothetical protein
MPPSEDAPAPDLPPETTVREVRYSLPQMLRELRLERSSSVFAREIIDQMEINQIFTTRRRKHARRRKQ